MAEKTPSVSDEQLAAAQAALAADKVKVEAAKKEAEKPSKTTITCVMNSAKFGYRDASGKYIRVAPGTQLELTPNQVKAWKDQITVV